MSEKTNVKKNFWEVEPINFKRRLENRQDSTEIITEERRKELDERWGKQYRRPKEDSTKVLTEKEKKEIEERWGTQCRRPRN